MLVVHPNSTCDVCLENYSSGVHYPHTIPCGHVFCHGCLDSLPKSMCPLCRTGFEAGDIRRLHIDRAQTPLTPTDPSRPDPDGESSQEAHRYQTDITRIVKAGAPASELRALIDNCHLWLKSQPHDQHEDLRVSFLLLYNLTETQRKLVCETEAVRGLREECEALRAQIDTERDAAERKYADLERCSADEKETALAVEKSLREHYEKLNSEWQRMTLFWPRGCDSIRSSSTQSIPTVHYKKGLPVFFVPANRMDTPGADEQPMKVDMYGDAKLRKLVHDDMFHLSPLPVNMPPLPSAIIGFSALAEDDDDVKQTRDRAKSMTYGDIVPRSSTEPIPIPRKPHAPRIPSGLAITVPKGLDIWESGSPGSFPVTYDVPMGSCFASSVETTESSLRDRSTPSLTPDAKSRQASPSRPYPHHAEQRERDPVEQREHRRVQLHDLLDSQRSASLPTNSQLQSILSSESRPVASRSHSWQSASPAPPYPISNVTSTKSSSPSPPSALSQSHGGRPNTSIHTGPVMSHASSAAIQLERDRLRAEKERENARDGERDRQQQGGSASSLRETTNAHHRMASIGNAKVKMAVYA